MPHIKSNPCVLCKSRWHTKAFCPQKPKTPINRNKQGKIRPRNKTVQKDREFKNQWIQDNPPDEYGYWNCYLRIHPYCPKRITIEKLQLEHVIPAGRGEQYKYDPDNVKPSEAWCNGLKGSQTLEALAKTYTHLNKYLT